LRSLVDAAREFSTATNDYEHLIDLVARRIGSVVGEACALRFVSDDGQWLEGLGSAYHPDPAIATTVREAMRARRQRVGEGIAGKVVASGEPLLLREIDEAALAAGVEEPYRKAVEQLGIRSLLVVPLRSRGETVGLVGSIRSRHAQPYTEDDLLLAQELADLAAIAITNARLLAQGKTELAERERLAARLRILSEVSREFAAATGAYHQLLELVARRISEIVGDLCIIRLVSADGEWLESLGSVYHPDEQVMLAAREAIVAFPTRVGEGPLGHVATSGQPLLVATATPDQFAENMEAKYRPFIDRMGITSLVAVPLTTQGRVMGVLSLNRSRPDTPYTDDDLRLLQDLAAHASLAITNSQLLEASKKELADRMRTEEVLRRGFLEAAPDAVLIASSRGEIILVNSQTETLFGYERAELVGRSIETLVPERFREHHPTHRGGYLRAPSTRPMGAGLNLFALRKDGSEFAAEISLSPIDTADGMLVAAAIRDVTERRREMEERNRRMQESNRLKSEFLANMSHELRTPLNAIIGFAALMHAGKTGPLSEIHKEYLGDILNSSRHLLQLINDVLDLAKVESGRVELRAEVVDLRSVASEVKDIVRGLAAERKVRLEVAVDPSLQRVTVDPRMLKQVLYNYLSNAIKFTPDGGRVALRISPEDASHFRVDVEDTGIGIKPEDISRLFVEFQQLDQGSGKRYGGTGLGLALTRRIVEAQGGRVHVESEPGKGSTFSAVLPREVQITGGGASESTAPEDDEEGA